jgi:hypothetical protein
VDQLGGSRGRPGDRRLERRSWPFESGNGTPELRGVGDEGD